MGHWRALKGGDVANAIAIKASNWFYIAAVQLAMEPNKLYAELEGGQVSKDTLRDFVGARTRPHDRTISRMQAAVADIHRQRLRDKVAGVADRLISCATYLEKSPIHVIKRPMSLHEDVLSAEQRSTFNRSYTGVYNLYRKESGPIYYIRDRLVIHHLFRNHFPTTLVSYVPDGHEPTAKNLRVYRGFSYINNTVMTNILARESKQRRFDLCTLSIQRTQAPTVTVLSGLLTSLTTSLGLPMAAPVVLCRATNPGIDLDFPELWSKSLDRLVKGHSFVADADLKRRHKIILGDRNFLLGDNALEVQREFSHLAQLA